MKRLLGTLGCAIAIAVAAPAGASTVQFTGFSNGWADVSVNPVSPVHPNPVPAGRYNSLLDGTQSFYSFCIDLLHGLSFNTSYSNYAPVAAAAYLGNATKAIDLARLANGFMGLLNDTTTTAAFQLAIWEITYETSGSYSLTPAALTSFSATGAAGVPANAIAMANTWLANLPGNAGTWQATVLDATNPDYQDVVTFSQAPVPGALVLMFSGLLGLFGFSRRARA